MDPVQATLLASRTAGAPPLDTYRALLKAGQSLESIWGAICALEPETMRRVCQAHELGLAAPPSALPTLKELLLGHGIHPLSLALGGCDPNRARALAERLKPEAQEWAQAIHGESDGLDPVRLEVDRALAATMPPNLKVPGELHFVDFPSALPSGLEAGFVGLPKVGQRLLRSLGADIRVDGSLSLEGCHQLREIGPGLRVGYSLNVSGCSQLRALPAGLRVGQHLRAFRCLRLESLAEDTVVGGEGDFRDCPRLKGLPAGVKVSPLHLPINLRIRQAVHGTDTGPTRALDRWNRVRPLRDGPLTQQVTHQVPVYLLVEGPSRQSIRSFSTHWVQVFECEGYAFDLALQDSAALFRLDWSPSDVLGALEAPVAGPGPRFYDFAFFSHTRNEDGILRTAFRIDRWNGGPLAPPDAPGGRWWGWLVWRPWRRPGS